MTHTRKLGPTLQSHVDLMRDLSGDLMVCKSRNKTNDTVRYPQRDRYEVRIAEWWQIREPIETSIKLFYKASFQHGVKHSAVNASLKGFAHSQPPAATPKCFSCFFKPILTDHLHGTSLLRQITDTCEYLQVLCLGSGKLPIN